MVAPLILMLVAGDAVVKGHFAGQSALGQQLQGAIDRGEADALVLLPDRAVELVGREVVASIQKGAQDGVPLVCVLKTNTLEMVVEDGLSFAHHFPRNRGL